MAELKKCPFCGGEVELKQEHNSFNDSYEAYFECKDCGARTKSVDVTGDSRDGSAVFNPLISLEALWNNRAIEAELRANVIDEFTEKVKGILKSSKEAYENMAFTYAMGGSHMEYIYEGRIDEIRSIEQCIENIASQMKEIK